MRVAGFARSASERFTGTYAKQEIHQTKIVDGAKIVKRYWKTLSMLVLVGLSTNVYAEDGERTEGLNMELTPYFWAAGVDGDITVERATNVADNQISFDRSFSDVIENVDAGFMGLGVLSYNRFILYADYDYISMSDDVTARNNITIPGAPTIPAGTQLKGELDLAIGTYAAGYRFDTFGRNTVDVLIGAQLTDLDPGLKVAGQHFNNKNNLRDTVVMLRPSFQLSEKWRFNPTLTFGVSGDTDTTYALSPQFQYQFAKSFAARFGYKTVHYESDNDDEIDISGLFVGVGWTFPVREKPVVAAPAPAPVVAKPAPVVAAAPRDTDGDGVPDTIDACPDTPKGTRVGPKGCTCDVTVQLQFKFDSAELTDADKKQLDATAVRLNELNWVSGTAEGHADNIGAADFNLALSQRRAQSAVDYLATKGISASRFVVKGFGFAKPIADNSTAEGRAQNRRVVLRRTDCDNPK
jgi:outer membrane protein OmpA-like peptidoglycan-associated protein